MNDNNMGVIVHEKITKVTIFETLLIIDNKITELTERFESLLKRLEVKNE